MKYSEQLKDPRWYKKRVDILIRDRCKCYLCGEISTKPQIHHIKYISGLMAWEYPNELLYTLCRTCHTKVHKSLIISKVIESKRVGNIIKKEFNNG